MKKKLVFLGGTVGKNPWRVVTLEQLANRGIDLAQLFNPVVQDWNKEAQEREEDAKKNATHMLFYIGSPMLDDGSLSSYSMIEATMSLYDRPRSTVVVFDHTGISGHQLKAMQQAERVLVARFPKANILPSLVDAIDWLDVELRNKPYNKKNK